MMAFRVQAALCLAVLACAAVPLNVQAQIEPSGTPEALRLNPIAFPWQQAMPGVTVSGLSLEGAVDPQTYILGPGDQFSISIGGPAPRQMEAGVTADGSLTIPGVASFQAAGLTLARAEEEALAALRRQFYNVPLDIALVDPRRFYVHVSGAVPQPNRILTSSVSRVSDVLEAAYAPEPAFWAPSQPGAAEQPQQKAFAEAAGPSLSESYRPSLRNVTLTRAGRKQSLDLFRYFATGDVAHNPYVLDGDIITVPAYHVVQDAITVSGEIAKPGIYPYRPGDTALDLLLIAAGPRGLEKLENARLIRRGTGADADIRMLDVRAMREGGTPAAPLQPGDHLNIPTSDQPTASIYGRARYPGRYPIVDGKTTLRELIAMAGGLREDANAKAAFIERRESNYSKGEGEVSDLDFFSRAYLQRELSNNHMVLSVEELLQPGAPDFMLRDGDEAFFPRDDETVFVTGNVPRPGYVAFRPGEQAAYYVEQAGGLGPLSTSIYVFETGTGRVAKGSDAAVHSGDTIFIDRQTVAESPEVAQLALTDAASRRQSRILTTQTIITGITAVTSIITAYIAITR